MHGGSYLGLLMVEDLLGLVKEILPIDSMQNHKIKGRVRAMLKNLFLGLIAVI